MIATLRRFVTLIVGFTIFSTPGSPPLTAEGVRLESAPSPPDNPLKGLVPYADYADEDKSHFPHSLEFDYLSLAELMRGPSDFEWEPLDTLLDKIAARGNQAVFRIWIEYPGRESGLPDYLKEEGVKVTSWKNADDEKTCYSPDYDDKRVVSALEAFIGALGRRYDGDPRIGFITAGLLGSWGNGTPIRGKICSPLPIPSAVFSMPTKRLSTRATSCCATPWGKTTGTGRQMPTTRWAITMILSPGARWIAARRTIGFSCPS
jgi:hypothetical protein